MYVLSADTAAKTASVCVCQLQNGVLKPLAHATVNGTLTHSESLMPMIDFCLHDAELSFRDLDAAVISVGPGSFTGVRIGVATFKGLGFARQDMPFIGVSTLEALAYNLVSYPTGTVVFPVMDARRSQFYNAVFKTNGKGGVVRLGNDRVEAFDVLLADLKEHYAGKKIKLVGDGAELFLSLYEKSGDGSLSVSLCDPGDLYEDAYGVARCAKETLLSLKEGENAYPSRLLEPLYLRASQAERERAEKTKTPQNTDDKKR